MGTTSSLSSLNFVNLEQQIWEMIDNIIIISSIDLKKIIFSYAINRKYAVARLESCRYDASWQLGYITESDAMKPMFHRRADWKWSISNVDLYKFVGRFKYPVFIDNVLYSHNMNTKYADQRAIRIRNAPEFFSASFPKIEDAKTHLSVFSLSLLTGKNQEHESPFTHRHETSLCSDDKKIYIVGGSENMSNIITTTTGMPSRVGHQVLVFDKDKLTCTSFPEMHHYHANAASVVLTTGELMVCGGIGYENPEISHNICEIYNSSEKKWKVVASMNVKRSGHGVVSLPSGNVLVCGGVQRGTNYAYHFLDSMEIYNCRDDSWTLLTSKLPVGTYGIHLKLHGHMLYMSTLPRKNTKDWGSDDQTGVEAWCIDITDFSFTKIHQYDVQPLQNLLLF